MRNMSLTLRSQKAASLVQSWDHFRSVQCIPHFSKDPDWHATSMFPLPEWLGISRLVTNHDMGLYFHSALMITFNNKMGSTRSKSRTLMEEDSEDESAEAVIYTPHGIHSQSNDLGLVASAVPPIRTLALLHGLEYITLGTVPLNLGAHNGLQAQRILKARYWIGTHDEDKMGTGLVGWLLRRKKISVKDAVEAEREKRQHQGFNVIDGIVSPTKELLGSFDGANWVDLGNGESLVLN